MSLRFESREARSSSDTHDLTSVQVGRAGEVVSTASARNRCKRPAGLSTCAQGGSVLSHGLNETLAPTFESGLERWIIETLPRHEQHVELVAALLISRDRLEAVGGKVFGDIGPQPLTGAPNWDFLDFDKNEIDVGEETICAGEYLSRRSFDVDPHGRRSDRGVGEVEIQRG